MASKNQFYAWISFQRRALSMRSFFKYDLKFISSSITLKWFKPLDYVYKGILMSFCLIVNRPRVLWIQLPPSPLMYLALMYKKILKNSIVIVDCHNGVFWGKWKFFLRKDLLNELDIIIVHNWVIRNVAIDLGIKEEKIIILEDKPAVKDMSKFFIPRVTERPQVLMPCSFNIDEPLDIVFAAASLIPQVDILISGPMEKGRKLFDYDKKPSNVSFLGYLKYDDFELVFRQSDLILGLTTEDHIQLSVANEAVGFEIPMLKGLLKD
jgi:hypothetical protein